MAVEERPQELSHNETQDDAASEKQPLLCGDSAAAEMQRSREQQQLLPSKASVQHTEKQLDKVSQKGDSAAGSQSDNIQDMGQCRICLEEDTVANLEVPCACTGTQRYAHKDCIQKWVNEKHHTTCEICDQQYKGSYVVPPAPPQGEPLQLVAPLGGLYLTLEDDRMAGQLLSDVYDDWDDHRQPTVSWCFSFMMFLLFMMFLHSTMTITLPEDATGSSSVPGGGSGSPAIDSSGSSSEAAQMPGGALAGFAAGASLFLLWLLTKLFLVVLPLLMVLRLAHRAQEQAAAEAAAAAGVVPGLDGPPAAAEASSGGNPYHGFMARLAPARGGGAGGGSSGGSSLADLEMELLQARRAAMSRLGRDPTFWAPATTSARGNAAAAVPVPASGNAPAAAAAGQQDNAAAAEQRMMAAVRAMVRAAVANTAHREFARQQQQGRNAEQVAEGSTDASGRLSGVV